VPECFDYSSVYHTIKASDSSLPIATFALSLQVARSSISSLPLVTSVLSVIISWSSSPAAAPSVDGNDEEFMVGTDEANIAGGNKETDDLPAGSDEPVASALSSTAPVWSRID
jgi:hypothetical protein